MRRLIHDDEIAKRFVKNISVFGKYDTILNAAHRVRRYDEYILTLERRIHINCSFSNLSDIPGKMIGLKICTHPASNTRTRIVDEASAHNLGRRIRICRYLFIVPY